MSRHPRLLARGAVYCAALLMLCLCIFLVAELTIRSHGDLRWSDYGYSELLVNYAGGFVRRGLLGSLILHHSAGASSLPLVNRIIFFSFLSFSALLAVLILISRKRSALVALLVVLMPDGLVTMAFGGQFFYRKEILFYVALCLAACLARLSVLFTKPIARQALGTLTIAVIFVTGCILPFVHESFLFLSVPAEAFLLATAAKAVTGDSARHARLSAGLLYGYLGGEVLLFLALSLFKGNLRVIYAMWAALSAGDQALMLGKGPLDTAFGPISWGLPHALWLTLQIVLMGAVWYWLVPFFAGFLYCTSLTGLGRTASVPATPTSTWIRYYLTLLISTLPLFILGWDWGRWMIGINLTFVILWLAVDPCDLPEAGIVFPKFVRVEEWVRRISEAIYQGIGSLRSLGQRHRMSLIMVMILFALTLRVPECCMGSRWVFDQTLWILKGHHGLILPDAAAASCPITRKE